MSDEMIVRNNGPLTQYMPKDGAGLLAVAAQVELANMFKNGNQPLTKAQAFIIMVKGAELGLSPMQSLENISIIKGKPFVGAAVITARIRQSRFCEEWDPSDSDAKHCTVKFKRTDSQRMSVTTTIDDIPQRYFKASANGEPSNWTLIPEDMLFAWTVRRIARRYFPDALLDLGDAVQDDAKVIDVAVVEKTVGAEESTAACEECGKVAYLHANKNGGAYSQCGSCGHRQDPPQEVRDAIRGKTEEFVEAEATEVPEPAGGDLEPGEKVLPPEETVEEVDVLKQMRGTIRQYVQGSTGEKRQMIADTLPGLGYEAATGINKWLDGLGEQGLQHVLDTLGIERDGSHV